MMQSNPSYRFYINIHVALDMFCLAGLFCTCILTANVMELMSEPSGLRTVSRDRVSEHNLKVTLNGTNKSKPKREKANDK